MKSNHNLTIQSRLTLQNRKVVKKYNDFKIIENDFHLKFRPLEDNYSIFLKDFMFRNQSARFNTNYLNCEFVKSFGENRRNDLSLCTNKKDNLLYLTNLEELNYGLGVPATKIYHP